MNEIKKVCKIHGELTKENIKTGIYKNKIYKKCKLCELERSRKYHEEKYKDKKWVEKKHLSDKLRWENKKEEISTQRKKPESKEKRRKWYKENIDRERKRYRNRGKEERIILNNTYIKKLIKNGDKNLNISYIPESLIELKKAFMMLKRALYIKKISLIKGKINENKND